MTGDPYLYFRAEARELVEQLGRGLLELEKRAGDPEPLARLFRIAHTLKGAARIVKHRAIAELAHALETALSPLRDGEAAPGRLAEAVRLVDGISAEVEALAAPVEAAAPRVSAAELAIPVLRGEAGDLAALLDGLSEIRVQLGQLRAITDLRALPARIEQLEREVRRVREDAEQLQLVPARSSFTALERTARDAAAAEGKRVAFVATGGEVRLEAMVLATVHGALVQLVRNAVAHGVEPPGERRAIGKPAEARVSVEVTQRGSRIAFRVADDGRGVDLEAVRAQLRRRGELHGRGETLDELLPLLLRGGVSTAPRITELAGRGVGLDVVREAASSLSGEITAETRDGAGTRICLTVPVSLATMAVLVVAAGGREAAVPLAPLRQVARIAADQLMRRGDGLAISHAGEVIPYAPLARLLGGDRTAATSMLVLEADGQRIALGVDRMLGVQDVVHRARPAGAPIEPIVSGVALADDGRPRPVLDPHELRRAIERLAIAIETRVRPAPILIVDDSLTTRMLEQSILESAGYDVELASSAEEALERALAGAAAHGGRAPYALFLVDVEMPGMDGFRLISELRARPALAEIPVILVTSRNAPEDRQRGAAVGANGYIVKGQFDQVELLALIGTLVVR
ncbi:MAG: response regulator [Kofleriaceae bacterium]